MTNAIELIRSIKGPDFLLIYFCYILAGFLLLFYFRKQNDKRNNPKQSSENNLNFYDILILKYENQYVDILKYLIVNLYKKGAIKIEEQDGKPALEKNNTFKGNLIKVEKIIVNYYKTAENIMLFNNNTLINAVSIFVKEIKYKLTKDNIFKNKKAKKFESQNHLIFSAIILVPGLLKAYMGIENNKPSTILIIMLIIVTFILFLLYKYKSEKTAYGKNLLKKIHNKINISENNEKEKDPVLASVFLGFGLLTILPEYALFEKMFYVHANHGFSGSGCSDCSDCGSCSSCSGCGGCGD